MVDAVKGNNFEIVKLFIEAGADLNVDGNTPLIESIKKGCVELANFLIEHGADVNINDGTTPLYHAEIYKLLIDKGANLNIENNFDGMLIM
jgi:ankyrin repeat protein